jgi:hypothetical protein
MFQIAANAGPDNRVEGEIAMNEQHDEFQETVDSIRTGIKAGEDAPMIGTGAATPGGGGLGSGNATGGMMGGGG